MPRVMAIIIFLLILSPDLAHNFFFGSEEGDEVTKTQGVNEIERFWE